MLMPSPSAMLDIWETGQDAAPWVRAMLLLRAAEPDLADDAHENLSIGERDARLIDLRALIFGCTLSSLARCPGCGAQLELSFSTHDLQVSRPVTDHFRVEHGDWIITCRLPTSADFRALAFDPQAAHALLLACIDRVERDGSPATAEALTADALAQVAAAMAEADPRADLSAAMACPDCGANWSARFDIVAYLWEELGNWARKLLCDIHVLASNYGWREADVLALSPQRRKYYVGLVRT